MDMNPQISNTQTNNLDSSQPQSNPIDSDDGDKWLAFLEEFQKQLQQIPQQDQQEFNLIDNDSHAVSNTSPVNTPEQLPQQFYPGAIDMIEDLQILQQHQNIAPINAALDYQSQEQSQQSQEEEKKIPSIKNYIPVAAVKAIQDIADQVRIQDIMKNYQSILFAKQAQLLAKKMLKKVIKIERTVRKNKKFLLMVFNPVNDKFNDKIKRKGERMTQADKVYFRLLDTYGQDVMKVAKKILIEAFVATMTDILIRKYAQSKTKRFKTDQPLKQQVLLDYLFEIKFQLRENGEISGRYV